MQTEPTLPRSMVLQSRMSAARLAIAFSAVLGSIAAIVALPVSVYAEVSALIQCDFVGLCVRAPGSPLETLMRSSGLLSFWVFAAPVIATVLNLAVAYGGIAVERRALRNRVVELHVPIVLSSLSLVGALVLYSGILGLIAAAFFLLVALFVGVGHPAIGSGSSGEP